MSLTIEKCIEGWSNCLRQMRMKADVVFFGDSLTYWGNWSGLFPSLTVVNLGLRGDTIDGMINRIGQVECLEPNVVFLMGGINDVAVGDVDGFRKRYSDLVDMILDLESKPRLIIQSLLPVNQKCFGSISCNNIQIREYNKVIKEIADERGLIFVDLYSLYIQGDELPAEMSEDGIHLKPAGYEIWYGVVKNNI